MTGIDAEDVLELTTSDDEDSVEAFAADAADQRSMWAFAFGARTGVRMTLMFSVARKASKAGGNFASRSWMSKPHVPVAVIELHQQVPRLLGGPGTGRVGGDAKDIDAACFDLHDEEHVQAPEEHGVDVQKVIDQLVDDANAKLDDAVKDGHLSQEKADELKKTLEEMITKMVNNEMPRPSFKHGWDGPGAPGAPEAPEVEPSAAFSDLPSI